MAAYAASKTVDRDGWIRVQKKTFTRWANNHLKARGLAIEDLTEDVRSGVLLLNLLEVIGGESVKQVLNIKFNKKPKMKIHMLMQKEWGKKPPTHRLYPSLGLSRPLSPAMPPTNHDKENAPKTAGTPCGSDALFRTSDTWSLTSTFRSLAALTEAHQRQPTATYHRRGLSRTHMRQPDLQQ